MLPIAVNHIAEWIPTRFDLPEVKQIRLLRVHTNAVYLVQTREEQYVLKAYGAGWRRDSEVRFEIDLLRHLAARSVPVALPIAGVNGDTLQFLSHNGLKRQAVLFRYAAGEKPFPPFSSEIYYREGQAAAALHRAADDFTTSHGRPVLDLTTLIDEPLARVRTLEIDPSVKSWILEFGAQLRERISAFAEIGLDWGVCHGDLTFDNLHITNDGQFVWYDFDSGGHGWRAIDLQGWTILNEEWRPRSRAFLDGYREVRPLGDNDIAATPYLAAATELWGIQVDLERRVLNEGPSAVRAYLAERVDRFAAWRHALQVHGESPIQ